MCEAIMGLESPEENGKQVVDLKSTSTESPPPPSQPTPPSSIKHCPLTPQSQLAEEEEAEELDESEEETEIISNNSHRNNHQHRHHSGGGNHRGQDEEEYEDNDNMTTDEDDMISVGGSPSPSNMLPSPNVHRHHHHLNRHQDLNSIKRNHRHLMQKPEEEYFKPLKKLRMLKVESPTSQSVIGVKSFSITDILSHKPTVKKNHTTSNSSGSSNSSRTIDIENVVHQRIVRPWDPHQSNKSNGRRNSSDSSPLDALFQMTSKTFEGLNGHHDSSEFGGQGNAHQAFNSRQPPKKKRKSRTAFTNHQIFELEKRFLYQKYLSPADRDEIAHQLGLTNAQVITWFQNRRAKLKRDMEEMKKDMESQSIISAHKTFLESAHDLALLKKRAQSQMDMSSAAAAAVAATSFHISSPTSSSQSSHSPINLTSESPPSTH